MPISDDVIKTLRLGVLQGAENLPDEEKRKVAGLISYLVSEQSVYDLKDALENAKLLSVAINQVTKDLYMVGNFAFAGGRIAISGTSVEFLKLQERLHKKGVTFISLDLPYSTDMAVNKLIATNLAAIATFENERRKERQRHGIQAAKKAGKYFVSKNF